MAACSSSGDDAPATDTDTGVNIDTTPAPDTFVSETSSDAGSDAVDSTATDTAEAGCKPVDAGPLDDASIGRGLAIATTNKCSGCHTPDFSGSTTAIKGAFPKNLTSDVTGIACETDDAILKEITTGIDEDGSSFCVMPKFNTLDDAGLHDLLQYLRSLPPVKKVIPATVCPADAGSDGATDGATDGG